MGIGAGVGIVTGIGMWPIKIVANRFVETNTNFKAGNYNVRDEREESCKDVEDRENCYIKYIEDRKFDMVVTVPILEESFFRYLPSKLIGESEKSIFLSRKELIVGGLSSLIFGGAHNLSNKRTFEIIPASQIIGGIGYWYLQRKVGFISNTFAHMTNNYLAFMRC